MDRLLETKLEAFHTFGQTPEQKEHEKDAQQRSGEYQRLFSPGNIENLQKSDVEGFLDWQGRWNGLFRQKGRIVSDMKRLKEALAILLNEGSRDIEERLDELIGWNKPNYIKGLDRAVLTAILHLVYPSDYGVYNRTVEDGLNELGRMPRFVRGERFGSRYCRVNETLRQLSKETGLSLAEVDIFVWFVLRPSGPGADTILSARTDHLEIIERHLQQLLADNWEQTGLAEEWGIYEQDGEPVGVQFQAGDAGRIDILCQKRAKDGDWQDKWLVIELKRHTGGHTAIGQLLGYMGWVQEDLASDEVKGKVGGLLIVRELDPKLNYALKACGAQIEVKKYILSLSLANVSLSAG